MGEDETGAVACFQNKRGHVDLDKGEGTDTVGPLNCSKSCGVPWFKDVAGGVCRSIPSKVPN